MVRAIERGLSLSDFTEMTFGMLVDYIITFNNLNSDGKINKEKVADQQDFDSF